MRTWQNQVINVLGQQQVFITLMEVFLALLAFPVSQKKGKLVIWQVNVKNKTWKFKFDFTNPSEAHQYKGCIDCQFVTQYSKILSNVNKVTTGLHQDKQAETANARKRVKNVKHRFLEVMSFLILFRFEAMRTTYGELAIVKDHIIRKLKHK